MKTAELAEWDTVEKRIENISELPTLPFIYSKLSNVLSDECSSAKDVGEIVAEEQALAGKMLRIVNSAFYGFPKKISSVSQSITIIGYNALKNMVLATSVIDLLKNGENNEFDMTEFWKHSLRCAVGAKSIGKAIRYPNVEELFVAGLLHDIGKFVANQFFSEEFSSALKFGQEKHIPLHRAENEVLGYDHSIIGYYLLKQWKLAPMILNVAKMHHTPKKTGDHFMEVSIIHIANTLARAISVIENGEEPVYRASDEAWQQLNLPYSYLNHLMSTTISESDELFTMFLPNEQ